VSLQVSGTAIFAFAKYDCKVFDALKTLKFGKVSKNSEALVFGVRCR